MWAPVWAREADFLVELNTSTEENSGLWGEMHLDLKPGLAACWPCFPGQIFNLFERPDLCSPGWGRMRRSYYKVVVRFRKSIHCPYSVEMTSCFCLPCVLLDLC